VLIDAVSAVQPGMWSEFPLHINQAIRGYKWVDSVEAALPACPALSMPIFLRSSRQSQRACLDIRGAWLADALHARPYLVKYNQNEASQALNSAIETAAQACSAARRWLAETSQAALRSAPGRFLYPSPRR
jgi:hypothetical protein